MESEIREKTFVVFKDHEGFISCYKVENKKTFLLVYKKSPLPPCQGGITSPNSPTINYEL
jgi:hypothetical protein